LLASAAGGNDPEFTDSACAVRIDRYDRLLKSGNAVEVTVELTPTVAASATSRRWQAAQKIELLEGGAARITFEVSDVGEVVRWALGFGKEARVVAPSGDVELAIVAVREIAATDAPNRQSSKQDLAQRRLRRL